MDFDRRWTSFAVDAEFEHFGASRIAQAHNERVSALESANAALEKRVEALSEALESVSAGVWDALYSGKGLSAEYAQNIERKVKAALARDGEP